MRTNRLHPSPALVISMIALTISISGVAVALPGTDTVNSGDIINGSIRSVDIGDDGGVTGADIANGSLNGAEIEAQSLSSSQLGVNSVSTSELGADSVGTSELGPNAVLTGNIASGEVLSSDIGSGAVQASEIGDGIVLRLGPIVEADAGTPMNGDWGGAISTAACESGEELISGAARFAGNEGDGVGSEMAIGELDLDPVAETVKAIGISDLYFNTQFRATAMCMQD